MFNRLMFLIIVLLLSGCEKARVDVKQSREVDFIQVKDEKAGVVVQEPKIGRRYVEFHDEPTQFIPKSSTLIEEMDAWIKAHPNEIITGIERRGSHGELRLYLK